MLNKLFKKAKTRFSLVIIIVVIGWSFFKWNSFPYIVKSGGASKIFWKNISYPGGDYSNSSLKGVRIWHSNLSYSNFRGSNLSQSNLLGNELRSSDFADSNMSGCKIKGSNLQNANLKNVDLSSAVLNTVFLNGSNLHGASLKGASLTNVRLYSVDFTKCDLEGVKLDNSYYDTYTKWPINFEPQKYGARLTTKGSDKSRRDDIELYVK